MKIYVIIIKKGQNVYQSFTVETDEIKEEVIYAAKMIFGDKLDEIKEVIYIKNKEAQRC